MSLNIDKAEMDQAWKDRNDSDKFYKYLYDIAKHQVSRKGISYKERPDFIQFAVYKCFKHQEAFHPNKGAAYSFFWKQISLAIAYKQRKDARRNNKARTFYVDQEKILDWIDRQHEDSGTDFRDIVDDEELVVLKRAFKRYNSAHRGNTLKPNRENAITILRWNIDRQPDFLEQFTTLKNIFKEWTGVAEVSTV
jgi:hypothetical protein